MDVILLICFIPAIISGLSRGLVKQIVDLVALFVAGWTAYHFAPTVGAFLQQYVTWEPAVLNVVAFVLIVVIIALVLGLVGKVLTKALSALSLGFFNKILGVLFAMFKCALILALLIQLFEALNDTLHFMRDTYLEDAVVYNALRNLGDTFFPILKNWIMGADAAATDAAAAAAAGNV